MCVVLEGNVCSREDVRNWYYGGIDNVKCMFDIVVL